MILLMRIEYTMGYVFSMSKNKWKKSREALAFLQEAFAGYLDVRRPEKQTMKEKKLQKCSKTVCGCKARAFIRPFFRRNDEGHMRSCK